MATFASLDLAQRAAGDDEEPSSSSDQPQPEPGPESDFLSTKRQPKILKTTEVSSIFDLKNELLKKKADIKKTTVTDDYRGGKGGILAVKRDEREKLKQEKAERRDKIATLAAELQKEEEEKRLQAKKTLEEKSKLYDKMAAGELFLKNTDGTPVEFLVDFLSKKKELEESASAGPSASKKKKVEYEHFAPEEEQRVYGVSHVKFSKDEETRQRQLEELQKLTEKTQSDREKREAAKQKADELKKKRIARARARLGLPELKEPTPEPEPVLEDIPIPEDPKEAVKKEFEKRVNSNREWDRGKDRFNRWIAEQREERDDEFRPPSSYYN